MTRARKRRKQGSLRRRPSPRVQPEPPKLRPRRFLRGVHVEEAPHAHIVCQVCGRIAQVGLAPEEEAVLMLLAERHPEGWSVDRVAFSLTGACRPCREGRPT